MSVELSFPNIQSPLSGEGHLPVSWISRFLGLSVVTEPKRNIDPSERVSSNIVLASRRSPEDSTITVDPTLLHELKSALRRPRLPDESRDHTDEGKEALESPEAASRGQITTLIAALAAAKRQASKLDLDATGIGCYRTTVLRPRTLTRPLSTAQIIIMDNLAVQLLEKLWWRVGNGTRKDDFRGSL